MLRPRLSDKRRRVDGSNGITGEVDIAMTDFAALRQRHSDQVLLSLLASTAARLLVSTMRTHHGAHERMGSLNKLLRALLASGDAAILSENIVKQMVRLADNAQYGWGV